MGACGLQGNQRTLGKSDAEVNFETWERVDEWRGQGKDILMTRNSTLWGYVGRAREVYCCSMFLEGDDGKRRYRSRQESAQIVSVAFYEDYACTFHLKSHHRGRTLLGSLCAAMICNTISVDTTLPHSLIFTCLDHYTSHTFPHLPLFSFEYIVSLTWKQDFDQVSLLFTNLERLCKVYQWESSFLNLDAVKGSNPFFQLYFQYFLYLAYVLTKSVYSCSHPGLSHGDPFSTSPYPWICNAHLAQPARELSYGLLANPLETSGTLQRSLAAVLCSSGNFSSIYFPLSSNFLNFPFYCQIPGDPLLLFSFVFSPLPHL